MTVEQGMQVLGLIAMVSSLFGVIFLLLLAIWRVFERHLEDQWEDAYEQTMLNLMSQIEAERKRNKTTPTQE